MFFIFWLSRAVRSLDASGRCRYFRLRPRVLLAARSRRRLAHHVRRGGLVPNLVFRFFAHDRASRPTLIFGYARARVWAFPRSQPSHRNKARGYWTSAILQP